MSLVDKIPFERRKSIVRNLGYKISRRLVDPDQELEQKYRQGLTPAQDKELMDEFWAGIEAGRKV